MGKKKKPEREVWKFSKFERLSFCNSNKLAGYFEINGRRHEWVGIGWIDLGPARGNEILVEDA